jgi:arylsulfatase A-like enzyme
MFGRSVLLRHSFLIVAALAVVAAVALAGQASRADSAAVSAGNATSTPTPVATKTPVQRAGPFVFVLVVDAARYDELDLSKMPNLARLVATGTTYNQAWVGQLPSVTEASHATIGTGALPRRHLILGDTWRIPGTNQMSPDLLDSNLDRTGYIGKVIQQSGVPSVGALVKQRWPGSTIVTMSGHKIYAADALGAGSADFVTFGGRDSRQHFVPFAIPGHAPDPRLLQSAQLDLPAFPRTPTTEDNWTVSMALKFLSRYHPRVMMVNLPEVDGYGHVAGTDMTVIQPIVAGVDHQIGRIVAAYQQAGMFAQTNFVITSDHGMVPAAHVVQINDIKSIIAKAGGQPMYVGHGDSSSIWLKNPTTIPRVGVALAAANLSGVAAVYIKAANGKYTLVSPMTHLAAPAVDQAYRDLLGTLNQGESPDIVLLYDENTITMTPNFLKINRKGDHGGATWGAQHIPLVIAGPGIRAGYVSSYPARIADIAPTIETLLRIQPTREDGVPLADAMTAPPDWAAAQQAKRLPRMTANVHALELEASWRPNARAHQARALKP